MIVSGFNRATWRTILINKYVLLDVSIREAKYHDPESFANDMSLLLKRRPTMAQSQAQAKEQDEDIETWLSKFHKFALDWGVDNAGVTSGAKDNPETQSFLDWFDGLTKMYLAINEADRKLLLDWMSRGAELKLAAEAVRKNLAKAANWQLAAPPVSGQAIIDGSEVAC